MAVYIYIYLNFEIYLNLFTDCCRLEPGYLDIF